MLRTNLSTRPFYNERTVHVVLGVAAIVVIAVTVFDVTRIVALSQRHTESTLRAERDEAAARDVGSRTAGVRGALDGAELQGVEAAVREANSLIDQRTFSWTDLFNRLETTLPANVMMTSVRPEIADGVVLVGMVVIGRRVEDIDQFMEQLEATGAFADLLARQEEAIEDGMYRTALRGRYLGGDSTSGGVDAPPGPES